MAIFIVFVVGAVIIGAGSMLSPSWPTKQPRVGISASFSLALLVGGAVWWASLFSWGTLVIDYLMFALVSFVVLGGTLSGAQARAEAKGEELADQDMGWTGPEDLAFFAIVALLAIMPMLLVPLPAGIGAAETGFLAVLAKQGGTLNTLAPFHPDVYYLHPPGYPAIVAYLSAQMHQPISMVLSALAAVSLVLAAWSAYDLGSELGDKRLGRATTLALLIGVGLLRTYLGGNFTHVMGFAFAITAFILLIRIARGGSRFDLIGGGLMLGAACIANFEMGVVALLAYVAVLITYLLPFGERPTRKSWLNLTLGIGVVFFFGVGPWLVNNWTLITNVQRFADGPTMGNLSVILQNNLVLLPLALLGIWVAWKDRTHHWLQVTVICLIWLLLVVDLTVIGILPTLLPFIANNLNLELTAQIGAIIPLTTLAGMGLLWLWERIPLGLRSIARARIYWLAGAGVIVLSLVIAGGDTTWQSIQDTLMLDDVYGTQEEIDASRWMYENLPTEATILTAPTQIWVPVLAERDALASMLYPGAADQPDVLHTLPDDTTPYNTLIDTSVFEEDALADYTHVLTNIPSDDVDQLQAIEENEALDLIYNEGMQVWEIR